MPKKINIKSNYQKQPLKDVMDYVKMRALNGELVAIPNADDVPYVVKHIPYQDLPLYMNIRVVFSSEARQDIAVLHGQQSVLNTDLEMTRLFLESILERLNAGV